MLIDPCSFRVSATTKYTPCKHLNRFLNMTTKVVLKQASRDVYWVDPLETADSDKAVEGDGPRYV